MRKTYFTDLSEYPHRINRRGNIIVEPIYGLDTVDITGDFLDSDYKVITSTGEKYQVIEFQVSDSDDFPGHDKLVLISQKIQCL